MTTQTIKNKGIKFWTSTTLFIILLITISALTYNNMRGVILGVKIDAEIKNPENKSFSKVSGIAKNATLITLNGREITLDKNGIFEEAIALPDGYSVITLEAQDKFGANSKKTFEVYTLDSKSVAIGDMKKNIINN